MTHGQTLLSMPAPESCRDKALFQISDRVGLLLDEIHPRVAREGWEYAQICKPVLRLPQTLPESGLVLFNRYLPGRELLELLAREPRPARSRVGEPKCDKPGIGRDGARLWKTEGRLHAKPAPG
jgi:hypothetical protein